MDASEHADATGMIPPMDRLVSTVVEVRKHTPEQIREMHLP